jgi:hypothetical protein
MASTTHIHTCTKVGLALRARPACRLTPPSVFLDVFLLPLPLLINFIATTSLLDLQNMSGATPLVSLTAKPIISITDGIEKF